MKLKSVKDRIEYLREQIREHDHNYYVLAEPTISDREFDILLQELEQLEYENPHLITPDSPTQIVGNDLTETSILIKHNIPMLSIKNESKLQDFEKRVRKNKLLQNEAVEYIIEPKIDGLSVSLNYVQGVLKTASTRGDGEFGEDILENVKTIIGIPQKIYKESSIPYRLDDVEVRGEIYISLDDFESLNKDREKNGNSLFENPRNLAAGIIKMKDSNEVAQKPLSYFMYSLVSVNEKFYSQEENLEILRKLGFKVNEYSRKCFDIESVIETCEELEGLRKTLPYQIDGAVIKVNYIRQQEVLGISSRLPKWACAYKFAPEQAMTKLNKITWQVGRTGAITPVAELKPVKLAGSTISRATLHNYDEIQRKDIRVGDTVVIEKGGDVIPKVVKVIKGKGIKRGSKTKPPLYCPLCSSLLEKMDDEVAFYCKNPQCPGQLKSLVQHFVSRGALNIDAIGSIVSDKLIDAGLVKEPLDLFKLDLKTLASFNLGSFDDPHLFGEKNALKVIQALEKAKTKPLEKWLFAIGIPKLGKIGAQAVADKHKTFQNIINSSIIVDVITLNELMGKAILLNPRSKQNRDKSAEEKFLLNQKHSVICDKIIEVGDRLVQIGWYQNKSEKSKKMTEKLTPEYSLKPNEGIGAEAAKSLHEFIKSNKGKEIIKKINSLGIQPGKTEKLGSILAGKIFILTGTLPNLSRVEAVELIVKNGGKVASGFSKSADFVLAGADAGTKLSMAKDLGMNIISEEEFKKMISNPTKKHEQISKSLNSQQLDIFQEKNENN